MLRALFSLFMTLLVLGCLALGLAYFYGPIWLTTEMNKPGTSEREQIFTVRSGQSARAVLDQLAQAGIIEDTLIPRISLRLTPRSFKAGEYRLPAGASVAQVFDILHKGEAIAYRVTIPEGLTVKQIIARLNAVEELTGGIDPLPAEGSLLPNTYEFQKGDSRQSLIERMQAALLAEFWPLWEQRAPDLPFSTPEEAIVLASIVEKETALPAERPDVAAVYINRLRQGWLLNADPTLVYYESDGLGALGRGLTRAELKDDNPYNTYIYKGLPPGPIANVGVEAIQAVLNPAQSDYMFFVADGSGGHAFAVTLEEHNANVRKWRAIEAAR